ncbi:unnamed protein product [Blepharisma stoltei]|uniref:Uncharacterized protein n=1 Tax=Blepharisma stoltei TaxID=1481888 RepID=A0AAU9IGQ1_9CILI|nr:unnamed protein product [Blepharisma stoltei]
MEVYTGHLFRSQPPIVRMGGYSPPKISVKSKTTAHSLASTIEDSSFIGPLKIVRVSSTSGDRPIAIVPENLGRTQRIPVLFKDFKKIKQFKPPTNQPNVILSEITADLTSWKSSTTQPKLIRPNTVKSNSVSKFCTARLSLDSPRSSTFKRLTIRSSSSTKKDLSKKTSRLIWNPSQLHMKLQRDGENGPAALLNTQALEEKLYEEFPEKLNILHYKGGYRSGQREGTGKIEYENGDWYEGNWMGNMRNGKGTYFYSAMQAHYTGCWKDNLKHGPGAMKLRSGHEIEGDWKDDVLQGDFVTILYAEGGKYQGSIVNGKREGRGVMIYQGAARYEGEWVADMRQGLGMLIFPNKSWFEGKFYMDYTCGQGVYVIPEFMPKDQSKPPPPPPPPPPPKRKVFVYNNRKEPPPVVIDYEAQKNKALTQYKYRIFGKKTGLPTFDNYQITSSDVIFMSSKSGENIGEFRSGKLNGYGIAFYGKYALYEGNFQDGLKNGPGKISYTDPDHEVSWLPEFEADYEGEWKNDLRNGKGTISWPNGIKYVGNFKSDRRHNVLGTLYFLNGDIYEGEWMEELMHGRGKFTTPDKREYRGRFLNGEFGGEGFLIFPNGDKYEGEVKTMLPEGRGKLYLLNGNKYNGQFHNGIMDGNGHMEYTNGDEYIGEWNQNQRNGFGLMKYKETEEVYEGWWIQDKRQGQGTLYNHKKEVRFSGNWFDDKKEGEGEMILQL